MSRVVGIDAGGTKLAAGLVELPSGKLIRRREVPANPARGGNAVLADCIALAQEVAAGQADRIGIAVPELVTPDGRIASAATWDWREADLASAFARIGPVRVESDVRAAAAAEARLGAGQGLSSFLYLTIGTGVSHTFVLDGRPWPGARGNAIVVGAPPVEWSASGAALAARTGKARAEDVLGCAQDEAVVDDVSRTLAVELARLVNALDPETVIIGGGLGLVPEFRLRVTALAREHIYATGTRSLPIVGAAFGRDAGIVGAALAAGTLPGRGAGGCLVCAAHVLVDGQRHGAGPGAGGRHVPDDALQRAVHRGRDPVQPAKQRDLAVEEVGLGRGEAASDGLPGRSAGDLLALDRHRARQAMAPPPLGGRGDEPDAGPGEALFALSPGEPVQAALADLGSPGGLDAVRQVREQFGALPAHDVGHGP
jgi:glucokinase